jgi:hypothetical protein
MRSHRRTSMGVNLAIFCSDIMIVICPFHLPKAHISLNVYERWENKTRHTNTGKKTDSKWVYNFDVSVMNLTPFSIFTLNSGIASLSKFCSNGVRSPKGKAFLAPSTPSSMLVEK